MTAEADKQLLWLKIQVIYIHTRVALISEGLSHLVACECVCVSVRIEEAICH